MKRLFLFVAAFVATTACSSFEEGNYNPTEEGVAITLDITANDNADTRVAVDTSSDDYWAVTWAEDDDVMLYPTNQQYYGAIQMVIADGGYDPETAKFEAVVNTDYGQGGLQINTNYRIVHPYKVPEGTIRNSMYTFDLELQDEGIKNTYTVSTTNVTVDEATTEYEAPDFSMSQVGAILNLKFNFENVPEDLTLKSVKVLDVPVKQTVDLAVMDVNDDAFYGAQTNGDINITVDDIALTKGTDETIYIKHNIFPFATEDGLKFKLYFENADGDTYILEKESVFSATFPRATFTTVNLNCDMSKATDLGKAIEIKEVKVAGNYISMNVEVNTDVCDGYLYNYAYPEDYCALDEKEDEKDEGLDDPNGGGATGQTPYGYESAFAYNSNGWHPASIELLDDNKEFTVGIVAYKMVGGKRQMVGEPVEYNFTTTSRDAVFGDSTCSVSAELSAFDYTSFSATFTRNNAFSYYRGYAPKAEVDALAGSDVAAKISTWLYAEDPDTGANWFGENINNAKTFYSSSYKKEVFASETLSEQFNQNLAPGTDYYFFTFAIDQDGIGPIVSQEFKTKAIVENAALTPSVEVSTLATSASAKFTFGGSQKVMYYNVKKADTDPESENYLSDEAIYANIVSNKYYSACYNEATASEIYNLTTGSEYVLYYVGIDASGAASKLCKEEYTCVAPTFTSSASLAFNVVKTEEYETTGWATEVGLDVTLGVEMNGAVKYIYGLYSGNQLAGQEGDDLGIYVLSSRPTTASDESVVLRFPEGKGMKAVFIPVDADGKYGAPQVYSYSPNTYDPAITATLALLGEVTTTSERYGESSTFSLEVTLGSEAVSYIYSPISKGDASIDFNDTVAVGDYVIKNGITAEAGVTTIADITLTDEHESCVAIVPVDADGNYGTAATYIYGAWLSDMYSSDATVEAEFVEYKNEFDDDYGRDMSYVKLNITKQEGAVEYYYMAMDLWGYNIDGSITDRIQIAKNVISSCDDSLWGSKLGTEDGVSEWIWMNNSNYDVVIVAKDANGKYGMPVVFDYTEEHQKE